MKVLLCVALLLTGAGAAARASAASPGTALAGAELPAIGVAVLTSPDLSESIVNEICGETAAIWGQAGISFEWHRIRSRDVERAWRLEVTVDDRQRDGTSWQAALGWITFTPDGPKPSIHLSRTSVEDLLLREASALHHGPMAAHDAMVGRALGRALSHELGHYFLSSKAHSPRGLMRATWPSDELFAAWRGGFELTTEERVAAIRAFGRTH